MTKWQYIKYRFHVLCNAKNRLFRPPLPPLSQNIHEEKFSLLELSQNLRPSFPLKALRNKCYQFIRFQKASSYPAEPQIHIRCVDDIIFRIQFLGYIQTIVFIIADYCKGIPSKPTQGTGVLDGWSYW